MSDPKNEYTYPEGESRYKSDGGDDVVFLGDFVDVGASVKVGEATFDKSDGSIRFHFANEVRVISKKDVSAGNMLVIDKSKSGLREYKGKNHFFMPFFLAGSNTRFELMLQNVTVMDFSYLATGDVGHSNFLKSIK